MGNLRAGRDSCTLHGTILNGFETFTFCSLCDKENTTSNKGNSITSDRDPIVSFGEINISKPRVNNVTMSNCTAQAVLPFLNVKDTLFICPHQGNVYDNSKRTLQINVESKLYLYELQGSSIGGLAHVVLRRSIIHIWMSNGMGASFTASEGQSVKVYKILRKSSNEVLFRGRTYRTN